MNVELITYANLLRKRVAKQNFCRGMPITDCLTVVQTTLSTLTFSMLDLQYRRCQSFICIIFITNNVKEKCPCANQLRLLFTDTDSLAYAVQTDDIYEHMAVDATGRYDFSEHPIDHPFYSAWVFQARVEFDTNGRVCVQNVMLFYARVK